MLVSLRVSPAVAFKRWLGMDPSEDRDMRWPSSSPRGLRAIPFHVTSPSGLSSWAAELLTWWLWGPKSEHFKVEEAEAASLLKAGPGTTLHYFLRILQVNMSAGQLSFHVEGTTGVCESQEARFTGGHLWRTAATIIVLFVNFHQRLILDHRFFISCSPHSALVQPLLWPVSSLFCFIVWVLVSCFFFTASTLTIFNFTGSV